MKYPENERILIVRPCLKYICLGNKPASKLLSLLLYYARNCDENEAEYTFMTTQEELIEDLIDEMDVKTLHRTAIPMLRLLGFLDVDGSSYRYKYTVHLNLISYLLANYKDNKREIASVLLSEMKEQLDKLPIEQKDTFPLVHVRRQLDNCLIQIDNLPIQLEKCPIQIDICLIPFRQMSNSKRGRKPSPEVHLEAISEDHRLDRDITDNKEKKREREVADATARSQSSSQDRSFQEQVVQVFGEYLVLNGINLKVKLPADDETEKREAVKPSQKGQIDGDASHHRTPNQHSDHAIRHLLGTSDDTHRVAPPQSRKDTNKVTEPPAPRKPPTNPVPRRPKQQGLMDELPEPPPPEAIAIMDRWDSNHTKPSPRGEKTIKAAILLIPFNPTKEELKACEEWLFTTDRPGKPWYRSHGVHLPDIAEKIGSWQSLQNAPPAKPEKEPSNEHKASSFYTLDALIERQNKQNQWKTEGVTS